MSHKSITDDRYNETPTGSASGTTTEYADKSRIPVKISLGVPFFPVRYAVSQVRYQGKQIKAPRVGESPFIVDAGGGKAPSLGKHAHYTLRRLRYGYLYIYSDKDLGGDGGWRIYKISKYNGLEYKKTYFTGVTRGTPAGFDQGLSRPDASKFLAPGDTQSFSAPDGSKFKGPAEAQTISATDKDKFKTASESDPLAFPTAFGMLRIPESTSIWLAFSDVEWTDHTLDLHASRGVREAHMRLFDPKAWSEWVQNRSNENLDGDQLAEGDASPIMHVDSFGRIQKLVSECCSHISKDAFGFSAEPYQPHPVKSFAPSLGKEDWQYGAIIALDDPAGVAMDLATLMGKEYCDWTQQEDPNYIQPPWKEVKEEEAVAIAHGRLKNASETSMKWGKWAGPFANSAGFVWGLLNKPNEKKKSGETAKKPDGPNKTPQKGKRKKPTFEWTISANNGMAQLQGLVKARVESAVYHAHKQKVRDTSGAEYDMLMSGSTPEVQKEEIRKGVDERWKNYLKKNSTAIAKEIEDIRKQEWARFERYYDGQVYGTWRKKLAEELKKLDEDRIATLAQAHVTWCEGVVFRNYFNYSFDPHYEPADYRNGVAYADTITRCYTGIQDKIHCFDHIVKWLEAPISQDNLIVPAFVFNNGKALDRIKEYTSKKMNVTWTDVANAMLQTFTLVEGKLADAPSAPTLDPTTGPCAPSKGAPRRPSRAAMRTDMDATLARWQNEVSHPMAQVRRQFTNPEIRQPQKVNPQPVVASREGYAPGMIASAVGIRRRLLIVDVDIAVLDLLPTPIEMLYQNQGGHPMDMMAARYEPGAPVETSIAVSQKRVRIVLMIEERVAVRLNIGAEPCVLAKSTPRLSETSKWLTKALSVGEGSGEMPASFFLHADAGRGAGSSHAPHPILGEVAASRELPAPEVPERGGSIASSFMGAILAHTARTQIQKELLKARGWKEADLKHRLWVNTGLEVVGYTEVLAKLTQRIATGNFFSTKVVQVCSLVGVLGGGWLTYRDVCKATKYYNEGQYSLYWAYMASAGIGAASTVVMGLQSSPGLLKMASWLSGNATETRLGSIVMKRLGARFSATQLATQAKSLEEAAWFAELPGLGWFCFAVSILWSIVSTRIETDNKIKQYVYHGLWGYNSDFSEVGEEVDAIQEIVS